MLTGGGLVRPLLLRDVRRRGERDCRDEDKEGEGLHRDTDCEKNDIRDALSLFKQSQAGRKV